MTLTLALVGLGHLLPVAFIGLLWRLPRYPGEFFTYDRVRVPQVVEGPMTLPSDHRGLV